MIWGTSLIVSYFYGVLSLLETVSDIVVFGIITMALVFGVFLAMVAWARDSALKILKIS